MKTLFLVVAVVSFFSLSSFNSNCICRVDSVNKKKNLNDWSTILDREKADIFYREIGDIFVTKVFSGLNDVYKEQVKEYLRKTTDELSLNSDFELDLDLEIALEHIGFCISYYCFINLVECYCFQMIDEVNRFFSLSDFGVVMKDLVKAEMEKYPEKRCEDIEESLARICRESNLSFDEGESIYIKNLTEEIDITKGLILQKIEKI